MGDDDVADDDVPETDRWQQVPDSRVAVGRAGARHYLTEERSMVGGRFGGRQAL